MALWRLLSCLEDCLHHRLRPLKVIAYLPLAKGKHKRIGEAPADELDAVAVENHLLAAMLIELLLKLLREVAEMHSSCLQQEPKLDVRHFSTRHFDTTL